MDQESAPEQLIDVDDSEIDIKSDLDGPSDGKNESIDTPLKSAENENIGVQVEKKESIECESGSECEYVPSNEESSAATTDSHCFIDNNSESPKDITNDENDRVRNTFESNSKVKSVIKLSASMQEHMSLDSNLLQQEGVVQDAKCDSEQAIPDNNGFFTFPRGKNDPEKNNIRFNPNQSQRAKLTKDQFFDRVRSNRVLVISVFGRSSGIENIGDKACIFDDLMKKDVFRFKLLAESDSESSDDSENESEFASSMKETTYKHKIGPFIEGYHDEVNGRIYLHMRGNLDSEIFSRNCKQEKPDDRDLHTFFSDNKYIEAKLLLFLFHVSHLLVCYHEQPSLDYTYVNLFQMLDSVRAKLHSSLGNEITKKSHELDLPKDVINHGRFCIPKLVFYFATAPMGLRGSKGTSDLIKRDGKVSKNPPIRKLEFSIEDQIYRIFRRVKLISTTSATSCLFSIPSRDGFVYVDNRETTKKGVSKSQNRDEMVDRLNHLYHKTFKRGKALRGEDEISSDTSDSENSIDAKCNGLTWGMPYSYQYMVSNEHGKSQNLLSKTDFSNRSFSKFLLTHIDFLTKRAEKGSVEGDDRKSIYELPSAWQWYYGASCIFRLFGSSNDKLGSTDEYVSSTTGFIRANSLLASKTSIENRFSESRCAKALPNAVAAYKEGLQPHYLYDYHQAKLLQAVTLFSHQSRGPSSKKYAELLVEECTSYWQSGRQMCEELSLTGHHCTNRKHLVPTPQSSVNDKMTEVLQIPANNSKSGTNIGESIEIMDEIEIKDSTMGNKDLAATKKSLVTLLSKLTDDNCDQVTKLFELEIDSEETLNFCIDHVFESAISGENKMIAAHAQICEALKNKDLSSINLGRLHVKRLLVTRCQQEFENIFKDFEASASENLEANTIDTCSSEETQSIKVSDSTKNVQRRALGVVTLCGELYKLFILTRSIMHDCIRRLIQNLDSKSSFKFTEEIWLECLCKLLTDIGKELENDTTHKTKSASIDRYFDEIDNVIDSNTSSKIRIRVQELFDLRQNNWIPSRESEARKITGKLVQDDVVQTNTPNESTPKGIKKQLPTFPHRSAMTFSSACNCGRRQVNRDDPFALIEANFKFYAELEDECCADLDHIQVPYYREQQPASRSLDATLSRTSVTPVLPSTHLESKTSDDNPQTSLAILPEELRIVPDITSTKQQINKQSNLNLVSASSEGASNSEDLKGSNVSKSSEKVLCDKETTDVERSNEKISNETKNSNQLLRQDENPNDPALSISNGISLAADVAIMNNENKEKLQQLMYRQCSSSESVSAANQCNSIPHMITTNIEAGKLPLFPSWALTQLGSSSVYAHSSGVNQAGFVSNTRNLLPWDVPLRNTDWQTLQKKWPNIAESAVKKSSFNPNGKGADMGLTVKVFIGLEYECPRGHRIIASSPGKTKSMTSSITNRMVNSDASLYIECQCTKGSSSAHPVISQLMRIHIVTPKAPLHITINPRVVPCPDGPTFHPGWHSQPTSSNSQIQLPISTYWVLRLPFIYWGEGGSHLPPKEVPDSNYGRLLKGFIGITEEYSYKS